MKANDLPGIDAVACFLEAARKLHFRAAAAELGVTPSSLGKRIQQLERQFGVTLFRRTTRKVALTDAGRTLLAPAQRLMLSAGEWAHIARGAEGYAPADLTVGTRHELGMSWLVPNLDRLWKQFGNVRFHLAFGSGPDLERAVRSAEMDCAVSSRAFTDPRLDGVEIHAETYAFVAAPVLLAVHPLAKATDAASHTLIDAGRDAPLFRYWRDAPRGRPLAFAEVWSVGTIAAVRALVLEGRGVAVLPHYQVRADLEVGALTQVFGEVAPLGDHFRLIFRSGDPRRALLEEVAAEMRNWPLQ